MVIKEMKKRLIVGGAITAILILVSTTTAVPHMHSTSVMNVVNNVEHNRILIDNNIDKFVEKYEINSVEIYPMGNISKLIDFLIRFLDFLIRISDFIASIFNITYWIYNIISQLNNIISTMIDIIEFIQGLFNPKGFSVH
jgi:hypothetical protein